MKRSRADEMRRIVIRHSRSFRSKPRDAIGGNSKDRALSNFQDRWCGSLPLKVPPSISRSTATATASK